MDCLFAGPPPYSSANVWDVKRVGEWVDATLAWLEEKLEGASGQAKLTGAWLHVDERSPHIHACIVPQLDRGELGWGKLQVAMGRSVAKGEAVRATCDKVSRTDMSESMSALQDSYWAEVGHKFGLERGQRGSKRKHRRPKHDAPMP